jgi:class 3 adenylate cyclase
MCAARKSFGEPDRVVEAPLVREEIVELGRIAVSRTTHAPGWRWSTHVRPIVGTERCEARHVGVMISGRVVVELADGSRLESGPGDALDVPPGHDAWVVGDEPAVMIEWSAVGEWLVPAHGERVLGSILFTDIVGSTERLREVGDRRWRSILHTHDDAVRELVSADRGREVASTGDGFLAIFDGPARAIHAAVLIRDRIRALGLDLRAGVHVGEIEAVGDDVRGVAVHEAARIMAAAEPGEILVSAVTATLAAGSDYAFESRGQHTLKGLAGTYHLFAVQLG